MALFWPQIISKGAYPVVGIISMNDGVLPNPWAIARCSLPSPVYVPLVDIDEPETNDAMVFPNPAKSEVFVQGKYPIKKVDVYNLLGQKVVSQVYNTRYVSLNVSNLTEGLYIVKINTDKGEIVSKITIAH